MRLYFRIIEEGVCGVAVSVANVTVKAYRWTPLISKLLRQFKYSKVQMNLQCALHSKTPRKDKNLIKIIKCWTVEFWKQPDVWFLSKIGHMCMELLICFHVEANWDPCDSVQVRTYSAMALRGGKAHTCLWQSTS